MTSTRTVVLTGAIIAAASALPHTAQAQCPKSAPKTASTCSDKGSPVSLAAFGGKADIVETAVEAGSFQTLVAALKAANLVEALQGDGPFTVFAPTDDAFAKLPKHTVQALLKPENREQLTSVLTFHVVPGRLDARNVSRMSGATSLNGQWIDFSTSDGSVMINGATVVSADIQCSNGIIHVIDTVILPASEDLVATARSAGQFNTLLAAASEAGLADVLQSGGPFTVLAPTDEAFSKLPAGTIETLLKPENREMLATILKYHVIEGRAYSTDAIRAGSVETLAGQDVRFGLRDGRLTVDNATVLATDIDASNGVVHVIDTVLIPSK